MISFFKDAYLGMYARSSNRDKEVPKLKFKCFELFSPCNGFFINIPSNLFTLFQADSENLISMAAAFHAMEQSRLASNESSTLDLTAMLLDEQIPLTISKNESGFKIQFEDKEMNLKGIVYSSFYSY